MVDSSNIVPTLKYLWLTIKHKAFVFRAGLRTGAPLWRLIIHDWSKFMPSEAPHYGRQFFGDKSDPLGFAMAWNHHQKNNPHHWEYWIMASGHDRGGFPSGTKLPMPEKLVREMVADWMGASRAYEGQYPKSQSEWSWLQKNLSGIGVDWETRERIQKVLDEVLPR